MKKATYIMRKHCFSGEFKSHPVPVEIIGESDKSYQVKLLERGPEGQYVGTTYWVRKHNVINIRNTADSPVDVRMPYID